MVFPVELEKKRGGLFFKLREESDERFVPAEPLGEPFDMTFEDRPHGTRERYGGSPRYGNFGEQLDIEISTRRVSSRVANAYLRTGEDVEVSKEGTVYGDHPPIKRPRVLRRRLQLYSVDEIVTAENRSFIAAFVMTWAGK